MKNYQKQLWLGVFLLSFGLAHFIGLWVVPIVLGAFFILIGLR